MTVHTWAYDCYVGTSLPGRQPPVVISSSWPNGELRAVTCGPLVNSRSQSNSSRSHEHASSSTSPRNSNDAAVPAAYLTKVSLESYAETDARRSRDRPSLYLASPFSIPIRPVLCFGSVIVVPKGGKLSVWMEILPDSVLNAVFVDSFRRDSAVLSVFNEEAVPNPSPPVSGQVSAIAVSKCTAWIQNFRYVQFRHCTLRFVPLRQPAHHSRLRRNRDIIMLPM